MTLISFIKLVGRHFKIMLLTGLLTGSMVFYLTRDEEKQYSSSTIINTGVVSGYNIENHNSDNRVDRDYTRNELENLIGLATAYETTKELALELLSIYLQMEEPSPEWISREGREALGEYLGGEWSRAFSGQEKKEIKQQLESIIDSDLSHPVSELIYSDNPFFGIEHLQRIKVMRKGASDMLEMKYSTNDPAVCQKTLVILTEIFVQKYRQLKEGQSEDVLAFFEKATQESAQKLREAEDRLLNFRVKNNIINYYEQTRFIADKKEDLDELFFKEIMDLEASKSTMKRVEQQLTNRKKLARINQELLQKRTQLTEVTQKLAKYEILSPEMEKPDQRAVLFWENKLDNLKEEMSKYAEDVYYADLSPQSIASKDLLNEWLQAVIKLEQAGSRLEVINMRKEEFAKIYSQFAPWGSSLKKIEREIGLAEDAYLENLHSYNQARLHLQNTIMSANLQVLDAPFYPTQEHGSKRALLIIVGFLAGFILTLGMVILLEYLDRTLKDPLEAAKRLDLDLLGVFPAFPASKKKTRINYPIIKDRLTDLFSQNVLVALSASGKIHRPKTVLITSVRGEEGASFVSNSLVEEMREQGNRVLHLVNDKANTSHPDTLAYSIRKSPDQGPNGEKLIVPGFPPNSSRKDFSLVVIEIEPLLSGNYPINLLRTADLGVVVCKATRTWNNADNQVLSRFRSVLKNAPGLVVNGTRTDQLENFLGEVPRRRSGLRIAIKQLASFNFSRKVKFQ
jgi:succinoglycan biosynthesis transport protein ExoP